MSWGNHTQIKKWHFSHSWQHSASLTYCFSKCCQGIPMKKHTTKDINPWLKPCKLLPLSYQRSRRSVWVQHLPHTQFCLWWPHFLTPFCFDDWINGKEHPVKHSMLSNGKEVSIKTTCFLQTQQKMLGKVPVTRLRPRQSWILVVTIWVSSLCL